MNFNSQGGGSIWNMDEKRMIELNDYMIMFMRHLNDKNYPSCYEDLESIDLILSGSIHKNVSKDLEKHWERAEILKRKVENSEEDDDDFFKNLVAFRHHLKQIFKCYNQSNIANKMYFRKGEDPNFAALKR